MRRSVFNIANSIFKAAQGDASAFTTDLATLSTSTAKLPPTATALSRQAFQHRFYPYLQQQTRNASRWSNPTQIHFPSHRQSLWGRLWNTNLDPNKTVWGLIAANGLVFLLWHNNSTLAQKHFVVSLDALREGRIWTLITAAFSHADIGHLAGNMISLYFFGSDIARLFGGRKLLMLYLAGGAIGSLAHCGWYYYKTLKASSGGNSRYRSSLFSFTPGALGASASVNAVMCLDILLFPTRTILLYAFIPMPAALLGLLWLWNDVSGTMGGRGGVAHAGHLGGAMVGLLYYLSLRRSAFGRWYR